MITHNINIEKFGICQENINGPNLNDLFLTIPDIWRFHVLLSWQK